MSWGAVLAYTPFVDPITEWSQGVVDAWWLTLPLLSFGTAMAYKAVRMPSLRGYWKSVAVMTLQVTFAMLGIAVLVGLIAELVVPSFGG
ncbi:MAG: hypothetical protein AAGH64_11600 [Planctomycetota bacterium]